MSKDRDSFGNSYAVIMAMAGSAIGLGNFWRFPYVMGEYGGAAFILVYILCTVLIALPIFISESIIGRRGRSGSFNAFKKFTSSKIWNRLSLLALVSPIIILSYYSVVGGWSLEFLFKSLNFSFIRTASSEVSTLYSTFISSTWMPIIVLTIFLLIVSLIVLGGVNKGIERFSKNSMPVLFVLIIIMSLYSLTLPGSKAGVEYLIKPEFSKMTLEGVAAAMGQSFFSLSLGVGTILTYASYVKNEENLLTSSVGTAVSDLFFALLAGFAIMPAVFAAGIEPGAGPGLVFQTIPFIFSEMGTEIPVFSGIAAIIFFLSILVAALSSAISMMEVGVVFLMENKSYSRNKAVTIIFFFCLVVGSLCSLSFGELSSLKILGNNIFGFLDVLCSNFLLILGSLLYTVFVGWKMKKSDVLDEFTNGGKLNNNMFRLFYFFVRYVCPIVLILIFLANLL